LQEEAAALGTPVLVLRNETEWTYLVKAGKAELLGNSYPGALEKALYCLEPARYMQMKQATIPVAQDICGSILQIISDYLGAGAVALHNDTTTKAAREDYVKTI